MRSSVVARRSGEAGKEARLPWLAADDDDLDKVHPAPRAVVLAWPMPEQFFDPRQLRSKEEKEEQVMPLPEAPTISLGQTGRTGLAVPAPSPVRVSGDIRYHELQTVVSTPMPEAWLALVAGLLTTASAFLTWAHASSGSQRLGLNALDLGGYGRVVLASGALTALLGLVGAAFRVGRLAAFGWVTGLAGFVIALDVVLKIANHDYSTVVQGSVEPVSHLAVPGLGAFVLGTLLTLAAAAWGSKPRVGG